MTSSKKSDKSSQNKNDEGLSGKGDLRSTKSRSKIKRFTKETIKSSDNPFAPEGLIKCLISDVTELKDENKSTQKSVAGLIPIIRKIVREELSRFRGYV